LVLTEEKEEAHTGPQYSPPTWKLEQESVEILFGRPAFGIEGLETDKRIVQIHLQHSANTPGRFRRSAKVYFRRLFSKRCGRRMGALGSNGGREIAENP